MPLWIQITTTVVSAIVAIASPIVAVAALRTSTRLQQQQLEITKAQNRVNLQWQLCSDLYARLDRASEMIHVEGVSGMETGDWKSEWDDEHNEINAEIQHLRMIAGQGVIVKAFKSLDMLSFVAQAPTAKPPTEVWDPFRAAMEELRWAIRADLWDGWPEEFPTTSWWRRILNRGVRR